MSKKRRKCCKSRDNSENHEQKSSGNAGFLCPPAFESVPAASAPLSPHSTVRRGPPKKLFQPWNLFVIGYPDEAVLDKDLRIILQQHLEEVEERIVLLAGLKAFLHEHPAEDDNCEQRCITDFGNKGTMNFKENTLSTSPLQGLETTDENSNTLPCCDKNGNEGFTGKHEAKCKVPENIADNTLGRGEETKCQSTNTEDLPKDVIAVVTLNESNTSSSGRIIIQHSPSPAKPSCSTKGPMTTEVNCDCLNVNVKLKKSCISNSETHLLIEKRKCPKKSRSYHDRQHQRSQCFSYHKYENTADTSIKHEQAAINVADVASEDTTTLKVSITGKDIEVKYNSNIQNVVVHIEPTEHKKTYNGSSKKRHKSCNSNDSDYPQTDESCISCPLSDVRKKCYANHKCPEWYSDIPPPTEFADCKDLYSNIIRDDGCEGLTSAIDKALTLTDEPTMLAEQCGVSKVKDIVTDIENKIKQNICMHELKHNLHDQQESDTASEACVSMQPSYHSSHAAHLKSHRNAYGPIAKDNISVAPKAMRRNTFPEAMNVTFLPFHHRRDSILAQWSSPAFHSLPEQEQAAEVALEDLNDHKNEPHKSVSCASSLSSLLESKPSQANDSMPSDQERALSISEPEESADDVFLNDNEDVFMGCEAKRDILSFPSWQNVEPDLKMDDEECKPARNLSEEHTEFTESGFDEELLDSDNHNDVLEHSEICSNPLPITTNPPFEDQATKHCPEKMNLTSVHADSLHSQPQSSVYPYAAEPEVTGKRRRGSVVTVVTGEQEQRVIIQGESLLAQNLCGVSANNRNQKDFKRSDSILMPVTDMEEPEDNELHSCFEVQNMFQNSLVLEEINLQDNSTLTPEPLVSTGEDKTHTVEALFKGASDVVNHPQGDTNDISDKCKIAEPQQGASSESAISLAISEAMAYPMLRLVKSDSESYDHKKAEKQATRKHLGKRDSKVGSKHLKLPNTELLLKDTRGNETFHDEGSDRWAKRRKQFKESKNFGSTGGSSAASNITEDSGNSEDTRSVDLGFRADNDEKGFYTENFHSASWIFRGDDGSPDNSPRCLSKRPRPVAIRERTVRIAKGLGDYPWGFRIQFSKPILVTEVDTNGAAEEAGLQVGDIVMAVNGTDVTSIAHSEAAGLARQGPDLLTLVVGSDVSRCPNTPKPTCRGYLHKRTHSGILKGWRKRWFVLKHDGCLYYYKQKKDEGKCRPLEVMKLEGSEIGMDTTLGKPFVFRCVPHSGSRTYYFCATSNQEMKRWLEAMEKAGHPVNQNHVWVDVTLHNNSLPPLAIKNPECLGLLHQLDRNRDMWIPHYCILKDGCLYFYASMRATHGQGGLYLQGYTVSEQCIGSKGRCVIEVKPPSEEFKTFYLSAENVTENKRWITALKISISKWLPLHQAIQDFMNRPLEETRM